jgi:hypothetical protein
VWLGVDMSVSRKEKNSGKAVAGALFGVILLLVSYLLLADWQNVPTTIRWALTAMHWPT